MNGTDLILTVERLRGEMRTRRCPGQPAKADEDYMGCISMLESCLSTGEMSADQRDRVVSALEEFSRHVNLGIIVNGRFSPISPSQAARWNIVESSIVNMFPVVTKTVADLMLGGHPKFKKQLLSKDWRWEEQTSSLLTVSAFYRRHLESLLEISEKEAEELGLLDLHRQAALVGIQGNSPDRYSF